MSSIPEFRGKGTFVNYSSSDYSYTPNNVADAFRKRGWLVELCFAQYRFVVAIDSTEASNEKQAKLVAFKRARKSFDKLGNIITLEAVRDTEKNRELLNVAGRGYEDNERETLPGWRNAA